MRTKNARNLLTENDIVFLDSLREWIRSSLEFTVLRTTPGESDLIFLQHELPFIFRGKTNDKFMTLGELLTLCEESATNQMIYEAWVKSALDNAYSATRALNKADGDRLITYFKRSHCIDDEDAMAANASEALEEAGQALHGEFL